MAGMIRSEGVPLYELLAAAPYTSRQLAQASDRTIDCIRAWLQRNTKLGLLRAKRNPGANDYSYSITKLGKAQLDEYKSKPQRVRIAPIYDEKRRNYERHKQPLGRNNTASSIPT